MTKPNADQIAQERQDAVNHVDSLISEYGEMLDGADPEDTAKLLVAKADWTPEGAAILVDLVNKYGSFMLSSAYALAVVLDIEDGTEHR